MHYLDISSKDVSSVVVFLQEIGRQRGVDLSPQLEMLENKATVGGRRKVIEWTLGILFGPLPH